MIIIGGPIKRPKKNPPKMKIIGCPLKRLKKSPPKMKIIGGLPKRPLKSPPNIKIIGSAPRIPLILRKLLATARKTAIKSAKNKDIWRNAKNLAYFEKIIGGRQKDC